MVKDPEEYPWSSYRHNALGQDNPLITPHPIYNALGLDDIARRDNYRALFADRLSKKVIDEIREATNKSWVLGDDRFKTKIAQAINRPMQPKPRGGDRRSSLFKTKSIFDRV